MNWEVIGTISDIVGALAVVLTLFYLARQIRQSNAQGRRSEISAAFQQFPIARMATAQNEGLADVSVRGSDSYDGLNPIEKHRFENLMSERFWVFHSIWDGVQSDAFEGYFWDETARQIAHPHLLGSHCFTKRTLRFAWHITTFAWWGFGCLLFNIAAGEENLAQSVLYTVSAVFFLSGIFSFGFTKGRHLSWIVFWAIAGLSCYVATNG